MSASLAQQIWQFVERFVLFVWTSHRYLLLCLIIALLFAWLVPYNTDEFIHYHPILCHAYPLNALNTFTGACGALDLRLPLVDWVAPLRSYLYIGSWPAAYYLPFFWLWPSPVSERLMNVLFLLLQALVLSRLFPFRPWHVFLGLLLFFPYAFQHIVDTGPVAFQILSVYALTLVFERWITTKHLAYPLLGAVLVFLSIWTKLIFIALIPGILIIFALALHAARERLTHDKDVTRFVIQLLAGSFVFLLLLGTLLLSTSPADPTSYPILDELMDKGEGQESIASFFTALPNLEVTKALLNPLRATHRVFDVLPVAGSWLIRLYDVLLYLGVPILSAMALFLPRIRSRVWKPLTLFGAFVITFLLIAWTKMSWAMHHTVLSFPFLVLAWLSLLSMLRTAGWLRSLAAAWVTLFMAINLFWFALFPSQSIRASDDPSKERINTFLHDEEIAGKHFYVITDWGMYFYQGLYGAANQSVLYVSGLKEPEHMEALKKLSQEHGRSLLFIVNAKEPTADLEMLRKTFKLSRCAALPEEAAWQILLSDTSSVRGC